MSKTLIEIAVEAGLVTKVAATRIGKIAVGKSMPIVAALVAEGVSDQALAAAVAKARRLPLLTDDTQLDADATREVPSEVARRLLALPLAVVHEGSKKVLRIAFADPTDLVAIAELEQTCGSDLEIAVMPLATLAALVDRQYQAYSTAVVARPTQATQQFVDNLFVTRKRKRTGLGPTVQVDDSSVTARVQLLSRSALGDEKADLSTPAASWRDLELRFRGLYLALVAKGLVTEAEVLQGILAAQAEDLEGP